MKKNLFTKLLAPVYPLIQEASNSIPGDSKKYKLSFIPFTISLLFGIISGVKSVSLLITEIATSDELKALGLVNVSKSMYSEAFVRYDPQLFRSIFYHLIKAIGLICIPDLQCLGQLLLVDGSIFPAISTMRWASYQSTANAIKMHLAFDLNKMTPVQFLVKEANYSEREFLSGIIEKGITYICDRGYISFRIFKKMYDTGAFFIIRGKNKLCYVVQEQLAVNIPDQFLSYIRNIQDIKVIFDNGTDNNFYRIVKFIALGEQYVLVTNRFDLTTHQIIMLYAYRWQIELFFRFIKRTLNCIHLFSHDSKGIQVQFYLYMIAHTLLLSFKQECEQISDEHKGVDMDQIPTKNDMNCKSSNKDISPKSGRIYVKGLVTMLGERVRKYWKIGIHWLTVLRNWLFKPFCENMAVELSRIKG